MSVIMIKNKKKDDGGLRSIYLNGELSKNVTKNCPPAPEPEPLHTTTVEKPVGIEVILGVPNGTGGPDAPVQFS